MPSGAARFHQELQAGVSRRSALPVMVLRLRCCLVHFARRIGARTAGLTVFVALLRFCSLLTIRLNSRPDKFGGYGSIGRRRATVQQRMTSIDHTILLSGVQSGVQCNALTIDNALLGQNMFISMDSATKHFILTFYEMKT